MTESSAPPPEPPSPPPAPPSPPAAESSNRTLMIILAYLGPLAIIPLVAEPDDADLQWHAKHGLVLLGAELALSVVLSIITTLVGFLGCLLLPVFVLLVVGILVLHVVAIVKGINGDRLILPGLSQLVERF